MTFKDFLQFKDGSTNYRLNCLWVIVGFYPTECAKALYLEQNYILAGALGATLALIAFPVFCAAVTSIVHRRFLKALAWTLPLTGIPISILSLLGQLSHK